MSFANISHVRHYTSETTDFLEKLKQERPSLEASQREGRELLWDKKLDTDLQEGFDEAHVPQQAYVYYQHTAG